MLIICCPSDLPWCCLPCSQPRGSTGRYWWVSGPGDSVATRWMGSLHSNRTTKVCALTGENMWKYLEKTSSQHSQYNCCLCLPMLHLNKYCNLLFPVIYSFMDAIIRVFNLLRFRWISSFEKKICHSKFAEIISLASTKVKK